MTAAIHHYGVSWLAFGLAVLLIVLCGAWDNRRPRQ